MDRAASRAIRVSRAVVFLILSTIPLLAQGPSKISEGLPPLIDRELFFGDPDLTDAEISPDGSAARIG